MKKLDNSIFKLLFEEARKAACMFRQYASCIIKEDTIISFGHARTVDGRICSEIGTCPRKDMRQKYTMKAEFFESCRVVHAEMDAILNCENKTYIKDSTLFLLGIYTSSKKIYKDAFPCANCLKCIKIAGIQKICIIQSETEYNIYNL